MIDMYFKRIIMLVMAHLVFKAIDGLVVYIFVDSYFLKEYKDEYMAWKNDNYYYNDADGYLQTPEDAASQTAKYQKAFSVWGPVAIVIGLLCATCCCGSILFSIRKY